MRIAKWDGCKAVDCQGKEYIDLTAGGIFACMFGPSSKIVKDAMARVDFFHCYSSHYGNYWQERYRAALEDLTGFTSFVVYSSGTEAVEAWIRIAWTYTGKPGLWGGLVDPDEVGQNKARSDQFHGWTLGSRILAGKIQYRELGVFPEAGELRFGLEANHTAGMAMEPYHAASGQFHKIEPTINRILTRRKEIPEILFLIDEIQGGFGRTGTLFAFEHYKDADGFPLLKPDFVTIGKLCGAGFPMAVLCGPSDVMESKEVVENAHLHSTHSWNPLACSVGCAVIEEMIKGALIYESKRKGEILGNFLSGLGVRVHAGRGLLAGIEFNSPGESLSCVKRAQERGVFVIDTGRKWVKIGPALTIEDVELERRLKILREVIEEVVSARQDEAHREEGAVNSEGAAEVGEAGLAGNGAGDVQDGKT